MEKFINAILSFLRINTSKANVKQEETPAKPEERVIPTFMGKKYWQR